jgi:carbon monoxide dehydrogenase subunit G
VKIEGTREFEAPRERVWAIISNPAEMARLMPGAEDVEIIDERHWRVRMGVPFGPGLKLTMNFEQLEERPPEFASMRGKGSTLGAGMEMTTSFTLAGDGNRTGMAWQADVALSGILGSLGERALQPVARQQVEAMMNALDQRLEGAT